VRARRADDLGLADHRRSADRRQPPEAAFTGYIAGSRSTAAYQWYRCDGALEGCEAIDGATSTAYTATDADVGSILLVVLTADNEAGADFAAAATEVITARPVAPPVVAPITPAAPAPPAINAPSTTLRSAHCTRRRCTIVVSATAGTRGITVELRRGGRRVARLSRSLGPGRHTLRLAPPRNIRRGRYALVLVTRGPNRTSSRSTHSIRIP
jgi:hypothetical protein